jgi:hypothetical protein
MSSPFAAVLQRVAVPLALLLVPSRLEAQAPSAGRIVVSSDEWFLSNTGFSAQPASSRNFVANLTEWFGGQLPGDYLAYSSNFSLIGSSLRQAIEDLGHTWTVSKTVPFDVPTLLGYDGIFLASSGVPDRDVLADYVRAGGSVLLLAGTSSNAAAVANYWNPFLDDFGLTLESSVDGLCFGGCSLAINSSHFLLAGVTALYHDHGQDVLDVLPGDARNRVVAIVTGGHERFAIFDGRRPLTPSTPSPGSIGGRTTPARSFP